MPRGPSGSSSASCGWGPVRRNGNVQRLDAFALCSLPHTGMKRVCYEVKASRSAFLAELKHPLKRCIGMRYFVTPADLMDIAEIPADAGWWKLGSPRRTNGSG